MGDGRHGFRRMVATAQQIAGRVGLHGKYAQLSAHRGEDLQDRGCGSGVATSKTLLQLCSKGSHPHGGRLRNGSYGAEDTVGAGGHGYRSVM